MSDWELTKTRFLDGVWEGLLTSQSNSANKPAMDVTHRDRTVEGVTLDSSDIGWVIRIPVPSTAIADGVQTILVVDKTTDQSLGSLTLIGGDPLSEDIRAEIDLLRAELDMLKRAFRRHCLETT